MLGTAGTARERSALDLLQVSGGKETRTCKPGGWCWDPGLPVGFAGGICRRSLREVHSEPAPAFPGLLLPSVAGQGIAAKLHTGKEPGSGDRKPASSDPPPLLPLGAGSAHGGAASPGMRDPAGSHRIRFLLPMKLPWELPLK